MTNHAKTPPWRRITERSFHYQTPVPAIQLAERLEARLASSDASLKPHLRGTITEIEPCQVYRFTVQRWRLFHRADMINNRAWGTIRGTAGGLTQVECKVAVSFGYVAWYVLVMGLFVLGGLLILGGPGSFNEGLRVFVPVTLVVMGLVLLPFGFLTRRSLRRFIESCFAPPPHDPATRQ
ncbi:MAG: hypothetical protein GYB65_05450 [Chloroflexi bacterium]|nr:hypothetical protein [Chloroflexota bacterium]